MIGEHIKQYRIEKVLGEGGMGVVYKAVDEVLLREVAIKVVRQNLVAESNAMERFKREARAAARFQSPNICQIFEIGTFEYQGQNQFFIVMEFIDGSDLHPYIKEGGLDNDSLRKIALDIFQVLHQVHTKGIVHRDLKPDNIMITSEGTVKMMDFGLAKLKDASQQLTASGIVTGTMIYASPEQIQAKPVDERSDIYSMGVILYELATGRRPYDGKDFATLLFQQLQTEPDLPSEHNPHLDPDLEHIIVKCLFKDVTDRFQSASEIVEELGSGP